MDNLTREKIRRILNKDDNRLDDVPDLTAVQSRRSRRNFWKNMFTYFSTAGLLGIHFGGILLIRFLSHRFISNNDLLMRRR